MTKGAGAGRGHEYHGLRCRQNVARRHTLRRALLDIPPRGGEPRAERLLVGGAREEAQVGTLDPCRIFGQVARGRHDWGKELVCYAARPGILRLDDEETVVAGGDAALGLEKVAQDIFVPRRAAWGLNRGVHLSDGRKETTGTLTREAGSPRLPPEVNSTGSPPSGGTFRNTTTQELTKASPNCTLSAANLCTRSNRTRDTRNCLTATSRRRTRVPPCLEGPP